MESDDSDVDEPHQSSTGGTLEPEIYGNKDYLNVANNVRVLARTDQFCFTCCICDKKFGKRVLALRHAILIHEVDVKVVDRPEDIAECKLCGKSFTQSNNLYRHMRSMHGIQNPPKKVNVQGEACPLCNRVFATINTVNIHIHRYHKFALNSKSGSVSSSLQPCQFCDLAFAEESACTNHMRNYHNAIFQSIMKEGDKKIYQCAVCNEDFSDKPDLKKHLSVTHQKDLREDAIEVRDENEEEETGETYNCNECCKTFGHEVEWISHMEGEHRAIPEACCRRCGDFSSKTIHDLKCHLEKVHSETVPEETPSVRPRKSGTLDLTRQELLGMEKIPRWLVKHGKGKILVVLERDL